MSAAPSSPAELSLLVLSQQVETIHAEADAAVAQYTEATGYRCPPACGACCHSPEVEVTVLDALPLAFSILHDAVTRHTEHSPEQNAAELMLEAISRQQGPGCPVFIAQGADAGGFQAGRCSRYDRRPSFCRLYGFAGWTNKQGLVALAMCRTQKGLGAAVPLDVRPPLFTEFSHRLQAVHPGLGTRRLPIHLAIKEALEKVLLADQFRRDSEPTPTEWGMPPMATGSPGISPVGGSGPDELPS
jgi:Fe-S-cluster containining protein